MTPDMPQSAAYWLVLLGVVVEQEQCVSFWGKNGAVSSGGSMAGQLQALFPLFMFGKLQGSLLAVKTPLLFCL